MIAKIIRLFKVTQIFTEHLQDSWLFLRHNGLSPFESRDRRLSFKTIIEAHTIEKGLSLPEPRPFFGQEKIRALLDMNADWTPPKNDISRSMLLGALRDYQATFFNQPAPDATLVDCINDFLDTSCTETALGGVRHDISVTSAANESAIAFLQSRMSARDFAPRALSDDDIRDVISLAQRAPSQCNRQSTRLHVYRNRAQIKQLLELQGGARGFAEAVPTLFVVTSEITAWGGPQQRNQPYVDGGIYTNMLLLALNAKGFVCCPLNLAIAHRTERAIKSAGHIPKRERLVVMVAAGPPPSYPFRVAQSPRWTEDNICTFHD